MLGPQISTSSSPTDSPCAAKANASCADMKSDPAKSKRPSAEPEEEPDELDELEELEEPDEKDDPVSLDELLQSPPCGPELLNEQSAMRVMNCAVRAAVMTDSDVQGRRELAPIVDKAGHVPRPAIRETGCRTSLMRRHLDGR